MFAIATELTVFFKRLNACPSTLSPAASRWQQSIVARPLAGVHRVHYDTIPSVSCCPPLNVTVSTVWWLKSKQSGLTA